MNLFTKIELAKTNDMIVSLQADPELKAKRIWDGLTVYFKENQLLNIENDSEVAVGIDDDWAIYKTRTETDFMTAFNKWQDENVYIEAWIINGTMLYKIFTPNDKQMFIPNTIIKGAKWFTLEV